MLLDIFHHPKLFVINNCNTIFFVICSYRPTWSFICEQVHIYDLWCVTAGYVLISKFQWAVTKPDEIFLIITFPWNPNADLACVQLLLTLSCPSHSQAASGHSSSSPLQPQTKIKDWHLSVCLSTYMYSILLDTEVHHHPHSPDQYNTNQCHSWTNIKLKNIPGSVIIGNLGLGTEIWPSGHSTSHPSAVKRRSWQKKTLRQSLLTNIWSSQPHFPMVFLLLHIQIEIQLLFIGLLNYIFWKTLALHQKGIDPPKKNYG